MLEYSLSDEEDMNPEEKIKIRDKRSRVCIYEVLSCMIIMAHAEEHNKVRMLFNLFDFDNNAGLE